MPESADPIERVGSQGRPERRLSRFEPEYRDVPCPVCRGRDGKLWRQLHGEWTKKCATCGHIFANPMPTEETMAAAYALPPGEFVKFFKVPGFNVIDYQQSNLEWQRRNAERHMDLVGALVPGRGALFELGCSSGILLEVAQSRGWRTAGVDPSPVSSRGQEIDRKLGIERITLFEAPLTDASFDVIFAASVVEHLVDPGRYLQKLRALLKPGGMLLVVALPNVNSFTIRLGIDRYIGNHPPGHLQFFSRKAIRRLLVDCGFEIERVYVYGMPETVLELLFGQDSSTAGTTSPANLLGKPTALSKALGAFRGATYAMFDVLGIGSVMEVRARRAR